MLASDNPAELVSTRLRLNQIPRLFLVVVALLIDVMAFPRLGLAWEIVDFSELAPPGTIVINTMERKLFFVLGEGSAIRYPIAVPNSTASRTVVVGDFHWLDRLAAWALIQGFDEREGEARADCRD